MKLNKRKGFTIVELVIVIAVIAILAAVLIPNISNLVKKANASADESLVRNLNTALSMDVEKHQTMDAALEAAKTNGGYDLTTIVTKNKDNKILWDSKNDCFVYLNGNTIKYLPNTQTEKNVEDVDYFEIVELKDGKVPDSKYSAYLAGKSDITKVETKLGLDVGKNTVAEVVFKTNEKVSVLINTNGGKLTVNAGSASVNHHGDAMSVTINAVASQSYHEFGSITGNIEIANGRVVMENGSKASAIKVTAKATDIEAGNASISIDNTASEVSIVVPEDVKTAIENKKDDKNKITASADSVVTDPDTVNNMSNFAGGLGTKDSPYLIADKSSLKVINDVYSAKMKKGQQFFFKLISDIVIEESDFVNINGDYAVIDTFSGTIDGNGYTLTLNNRKPTTGTIWTTFIYRLKSENKDDITTVRNMTVQYASASNAIFTTMFGHVGSGFSGYTKSNGNFVFENLTFKNADNGIISFLGNNHGVLACFVAANLTMKNCSNYINANSSGVNGVWLGSMHIKNYSILFEKVNNYGIINGSTLGYFFGNTSYNGGNPGYMNDNSLTLTEDELKKHVVVIDCNNEGTIFKTSGDKKFYLLGGANVEKTSFASFSDDLMKTFNKGNGTTAYLQSSGQITYTIENNKIVAKNSSGEVITLKITYSTMYRDSVGAHGGFTLSVDVTNALNSQYKAKFATTTNGNLEGYTVIEHIEAKNSANGAEYYICSKDGDVYYVFNNLSNFLPNDIKDDVTLNDVKIVIYGYNSAGSLIDYTIVK